MDKKFKKKIIPEINFDLKTHNVQSKLKYLPVLRSELQYSSWFQVRYRRREFGIRSNRRREFRNRSHRRREFRIRSRCLRGQKSTKMKFYGRKLHENINLITPCLIRRWYRKNLRLRLN